MAKSGNKSRPVIRGFLVELQESDRAMLDKLVERYQKLFAGKATKIGVIRQLIRLAHEQKSTPPLV